MNALKVTENRNESGDSNKLVVRNGRQNIKRDYNVSPSTGAGDDNSGDEQDQPKRSVDQQKRTGRSPDGTLQVARKRFDPSLAFQPVFYFGGKNGESLVESILTNLGWKRTMDKAGPNIKLRWTECKSAINYLDFREGEQLVNHIPNCELLTNKLGLLMSLREFERVTTTIQNKPPKLKISDFHPETYVLEDKGELELFYETFKPGEIWICKPTSLNQGIGIYLVRDLEQFKQEWAAKTESENSLRGRPPKRDGRIMQRYIMQPLLVEDRKFDIRCYMLISSTVPYLVLFHNGYLRLSIYKYNTELQDLTVHLTNQYIQKKDPAYENVKNDTVWSMEKFNDYVNSNIAPRNGLAQDWVWSVLVPRMRQIAAHVFTCVKSKFAAKVGYFELFGLDYMIDNEMKVWLIEINTNPSLTTNCDVLKQVIPPLVTEGVHVALECFDKARRRQQLMPVQALKTWDVLHFGPSATAGGMPISIRYSPPPNRKNDNSSPRSRSPQRPLAPLRRSPPIVPFPGPGNVMHHTPAATSRFTYSLPPLSSNPRLPLDRGGHSVPAHSSDRNVALLETAAESAEAAQPLSVPLEAV